MLSLPTQYVVAFKYPHVAEDKDAPLLSSLQQSVLFFEMNLSGAIGKYALRGDLKKNLLCTYTSRRKTSGFVSDRKRISE